MHSDETKHKIRLAQAFTTATFIEKLTLLRGSEYATDKVTYVNMHTKVCLTCAVHGDFYISPSKLLHRRQGCPSCGKLKCLGNKGNLKDTKESWAKKASVIHGDLYSYDKTAWLGTRRPVIITCKKHGDFTQLPFNHLKGKGCPVCNPSFSSLPRVTYEDIQSKAAPNVTVISVTSKRVTLCCALHGQWTSTAGNLVHKKTGCPKCVVKESKAQKELYSFICSLGISAVSNYRLFPNKKEVDIYIPKLNLAIEYNGIYFHSTGAPNYRASNLSDSAVRKEELWKHTWCCNNGVRLITILEDEWESQKETIKHYLCVTLGTLPKIAARKLTTKTVSQPDANEFLTAYHVQGYIYSEIFIGLYEGAELVALMGFSTGNFRRKFTTLNGWDLTRYCYKKQVIGGAKKLLSHFVKQSNCSEITSFCDPRLFVGALYTGLGFTEVTRYSYDYKFVYRKSTFHKLHFTKTAMLERFGTDDYSTAQVYKLFLPGQIKYRLLF